ncbi:hypothetical protein Btru_018758 [Bulinus truncatus]|nr:hypothetical protein Btru_018758 [Bulinus truncatus]
MKDGGKPDGGKYSDREMSSIIDSALQSEDLDGDGYVEYVEFMTAKARRMQRTQGSLSNGGLPEEPEEGRPPAHRDSARDIPRPPGY